MFKRSNATIPSTRRITVHRFTETDDFFIMNYERKHTGWVVLLSVLLSVLFSICTRQACIGNCNGVSVIVFGSESRMVIRTRHRRCRSLSHNRRAR